MDLWSFKTTFDGVLQTYIHEKIDQAHALIDDKKINGFIDYITTFIFSGGKRIRPFGLRIMYKWFGGDNEKAILNFGIIFELLHSMALIHDDIIDQADKRHNALTMHSYIQWQLSDSPNAAHIAEWQAILIGDLLLSRVYELQYKQHEFTEKVLIEARKNVHSMIEEVILGQMIDVDMMVQDEADYQLIEKKNYYKTASYTFIRPMLCGAIFADTDQENMELISELWKYLGLAFQLRDDMMDITFGDPTKSPFSDIQEWQQTYFTNYIFTHWTQEQKWILHGAMGNRLTTQQISDLQKMFDESWTLEQWQKLLQEYSDQAKNVLEKFSFKDNIAKEWFTLLIEKLAKI